MKCKLTPATMLFGGAGVIAFALIAFAIWQNVKPSPYDDFAQCLSDKGIVMYGAWWCPNCANQKKMFEGSFDRVEYIECSTAGSKLTLPVCKDAGISGYPTWRFTDGTDLRGVQQLETLSEKSGCPVSSGS